MAQKSVSYTTLGVSIGITILVCVLVYLNIDTIQNMFVARQQQPTIREQFGREQGQFVSITGMVSSDGDLRFYTHTLQSEQYPIVGLKSRTINLSLYKSTVVIEGTVDTSIGDMVIVDVTNVVVVPNDDLDIQDGQNTLAQYITKAGIYIPPSFFALYTGLVYADKNTITFADSAGQYTIQYFICTNNKSDTDCLHTKDNFAKTAANMFTTADGMTFYKMSETNAWFTHNANLFGYFFNDITQEQLIALSKQIDFPTIKSVEQKIIPNIASICHDGSRSLGSVDTYNLLMQDGAIHVSITGMVGTQVATCKTMVDYTHIQNAVLKEFSIQETSIGSIQQEEQKKQEEATNNTKPVVVTSSFDITTKQFPIDLEKQFLFTSSRGHSILFPTQNIAFKQVVVTDDTLLVASNCYTQQNIVSYANRSSLETAPSVILYECSRAPVEGTLPMQYVVYPVEESKIFVAHVIDGSWRDFANNITITMSQDE